MTSHQAFIRAKRAHERRWGTSTLPIEVCVIGSGGKRVDGRPNPLPFIRSIDRETGSVVDWSFAGDRLCRLAERQPTA